MNKNFLAIRDIYSCRNSLLDYGYIPIIARKFLMLNIGNIMIFAQEICSKQRWVLFSAVTHCYQHMTLPGEQSIENAFHKMKRELVSFVT